MRKLFLLFNPALFLVFAPFWLLAKPYAEAFAIFRFYALLVGALIWTSFPANGELNELYLGAFGVFIAAPFALRVLVQVLRGHSPLDFGSGFFTRLIDTAILAGGAYWLFWEYAVPELAVDEATAKTIGLGIAAAVASMFLLWVTSRSSVENASALNDDAYAGSADDPDNRPSVALSRDRHADRLANDAYGVVRRRR